MIDLGYVLRRAWEITWGHKTLWLFGFLISLGTVSTRLGSNSISREQTIAELPPDVQRAVADFLRSPYFVVAVVALVLLALVVTAVLMMLSSLARAGLVDQVQAAENYGTVSWRAGWSTGQQRLWPVFLMRLILGLPVTLMTLAGALPMVGIVLLINRQEQPEVAIPAALATPIVLLACLLPAACLAALLSVPLNVLQRLAVRACVLEERDLHQSLLHAWEMLQEYLGPVALIWFMLLVIGFIVRGMLIFPLALLAIPLMTVALLTMLASPWLSIVLVMLAGLLIWLLGAAVNSVGETFFSAVWTLTYRELTGMGLTGEELSPPKHLWESVGI